VERVYLYSARIDSLPVGRYCTFPIASSSGAVFRLAMAPIDDTRIDEYRVESYWNNFILLSVGRAEGTFEVTFAILRSVAGAP